MKNQGDSAPPRTIIFVDDAHTFGGAQIALAWAVKALVESNAHQRVICVTTRRTQLEINSIARGNANLGFIECPPALPLNILFFPLRMLSFRRLLKPLLNDPKLVWWLNLSDIGFAIAPLAVLRTHGKRPAAWLHNTKECAFFTRDHSLPRKMLSRLRDRIANRLIFRQYALIATPGQGSRIDVQKRTQVQKIETSCLYPISGFREECPPDTQTRRSQFRYNLWIVGRVEYRHKNQLLALHTLQNLLKYEPDSHLTILGGGPDLDRLKGDIERLNLKANVTILEWSPNPWSRVQHDAILLMPSFYEGMSLVVTEAMLLGIPVVASPIPSLQEQLPAEMIASNFTPHAFTEKIQHVRNLSNEDLRRIYSPRLARFSSEAFVTNFLRLSTGAVQAYESKPAESRVWC